MDTGCHRPRVPGTGARGVPDSHLCSRQVDHWAKWSGVWELGLLVQLPDRPASGLRACRPTLKRPAISDFDMAGLFIPYLSRNIPPPAIGIGGMLSGD